MALQLGEFVLRGEIINTDRYSVHGYLELRGCDRPLVFNLTGDCAADLQGKHLRFKATRWDHEAPFDAEDCLDGDALSWQQIGPTGEITAERMARIIGAESDDSDSSRELRKCLVLEWYGQNGRVVVLVGDPELELVDTLDDDSAESAGWDGPRLHEPDSDDDEPGAEPSTETNESGDADEDPYGLFPEGFEAEFESNAAETDRFISGSAQPDPADSMREIELLDDLIESGDGEPIGSIFETPFKLRRPGQLDDEEVEAELKSLLAQLALYNIAIDVCEHYSPRETYEWLLEEILPKESAYPELRRTQWVQHFSTSDDCEECDAEFDLEDLDDDMPF